jgi:hypothetical protein
VLPNDQRHRFKLAGSLALPVGLRLSPLWTVASAVPMDILIRRQPAHPRDPAQRGRTTPFRFRSRLALEAMVECFNVFNVTNILGGSNLNYSAYSNVLVRDSSDPKDPAYLRSSSFGRAVSTAGGVFGSGGARAFQLGARLSF